MLITNVVDIYKLNVGVFDHSKERSRSYYWKGLKYYDFNWYNPYIMTITDILISGIPSLSELGNPTRIVASWVSTHPSRSVCEE